MHRPQYDTWNHTAVPDRAMMQWRGVTSIVGTTQSHTEARRTGEHLAVHWAGAQRHGIAVWRNAKVGRPSLPRSSPSPDTSTGPGRSLVLHEISLKRCVLWRQTEQYRDTGKRRIWYRAGGTAGSGNPVLNASLTRSQGVEQV